MVYQYNRILSNNENKWNIDMCYNMDKLWKHYIKWTKLVTKYHILHAFLDVNYTEKKSIQAESQWVVAQG